MAQARTQSNAMLYALITFVALFVVGIVCAVIFYVKSEEYRTQLENNKSETLKIANTREQNSLGKIVGKLEEKPNPTYLGTLNARFDALYAMITGAIPAEELSADVKLNEITMQINKLNEAIGQQDISPAVGPNGVALLKLISDLKAKLDEARVQFNTLTASYQKLQEDFNAAKQESAFKEQQLVQQNQTYQQNSNDIQAKYDQLKQQMNAASEEQIQTVNKKLEDEQNKLRQKQMELTETQDKLNQAEKSLKEAIAQLESIRPRPDKEVIAFQPDAGILRVDLQNGLVYLDKGSEDHIYRGLTFAIYDRNIPIPEDGVGKAEIEVFQVDPKVSVARILNPNKKKPVVKEDIVANLIWDSKTSNRFVVIGDFDLNNDKQFDPEGNKRICEMIERWGGIIVNEVTINTDFVIIGEQPQLPAKPEQQQLDIDPTLQTKYDNAARALEMYNTQLARAEKLSVPMFNQKRFLYLIGYDTLTANSSAK